LVIVVYRFLGHRLGPENPVPGSLTN
jgi:hypothetical protein